MSWIAQWGTVSAMAAVVVSIVLYVVERRKKRHEKLREHADAVVILPSEIFDVPGETGLLHVRATATNYGAHPITNVWVRVHSQQLAQPVSDHTRQLDPGATYTREWIVATATGVEGISGNDSLLATVTFADSGGYRWQKWADGNLHIPVWAGPYRGRLPKGFMALPPMRQLNQRWEHRKRRPPRRIERPM